MNRIALTALFTLLLIIPSAAFAEAKVGEPAPDFTVTDIAGKEHSLKDFHGKTVVLEWTNHQCPFVRKHYETDNMQQLQKKYTQQGVVWLMINSSAPGKQGHLNNTSAKALINEEEASPSAFILDHSGELGKLYGAKTTPHMFVIDAGGLLVYAGAIDDNSSSRESSVEGASNYVATALDALGNRKDIEVASTQAYGCSVKYAS